MYLQCAKDCALVRACHFLSMAHAKLHLHAQSHSRAHACINAQAVFTVGALIFFILQVKNHANQLKFQNKLPC